MKKLLVVLGLAGAGVALAAKRKKAAQAEAALWAEATGTPAPTK